MTGRRGNEMTDRVSTYTGVSRDNPVPRTSRIGNIIMSSMIVGADPTTRKVPADLAEQTRNLFFHIKELVEGAGGATEDIIKIDLWMTDRNAREALDAEWVKMFPDQDSRPARHTQQAELDRGQLIKCTFIAVV
jgi:2-iminobutanoate/2-iminopropanoate deaminase